MRAWTAMAGPAVDWSGLPVTWFALGLLGLLADPGGGGPVPVAARYEVTGSEVARAGQGTRLHCVLEGGGSGSPTSYEWVKDGKVIEGETKADLSLQSVTTQDEGRYQCRAAGSVNYGESLQLHVFVPGDILPKPNIDHRGVPVSGRPYSVRCIFLEKYIPSVDTVYTWFKNGTPVKGQSGQTLTFPNVTEADAGEYTCTGSEGGVATRSSPSDKYILTPWGSPQITIGTPPTTSVVKGILRETLNLTCRVEKAFPPVPPDGYKWSYLPSPEGQLRPLVGNRSTLTLGPLTREDRGQYFCQAWNDQDFQGAIPPGNASVTVDVVYLENLTLNHVPEVSEGDSVTLTCHVDSHPTANLTWTAEGHKVRHVIDNLDRYVILSAACSDSNSYTCGASNPDLPGLEIHATVQLTVLCKQATMEPLATELSTTRPHTTSPATPNLTKAQDSPEDDRTRKTGIQYEYLAVLGLIPIAVAVIVLLRCTKLGGQLCRRKGKRKGPGNEDGVNIPDNLELDGATEEVAASTEEQMRLLGESKDDLEVDGVPDNVTGSTTEQRGLLQAPGNEGGSNPSVAAELNEGVVEDSGSAEEQAHPVLIHADRDDASADATTRATPGLTGRPQQENEAGNSRGPDSSPPHKHVSKTEPKQVPPQQGQKVRFDDFYKKGTVQVLPPLPDSGRENQNPEGGDEDGNTAILVIKLLHATLAAEVKPHPEDPPVFVFTQALPRNVHAIVYHKQCGAIIVKAKKAKVIDAEARKHLRQAAKQLVRAREKLKKELQHQLHVDGITTVLALPHLTDINGELPGKLREDSIRVLCGQERKKYRALFKRDKDNVWGLGGDSDFAFRTALSRYLSMTSYGDSDDPPSWLITPEQAHVLQCTDKLLHIWGPPGSGKTLLLLDRVRRWLWRGKTVLLAVASPSYELLLHRLHRTAIKDLPQEGKDALKLCMNTKDFKKMVAELKEQVPSALCVAIDDIEDEFLQVLLPAYNSCPQMNAWITSQGDLHDMAGFQASRGRTACLPHSLRFTDGTLRLAKQLLPAGCDFEAWKDWSCLPLSLPSASVKSALHSSHTGYQSKSPPSFDCNDCGYWLKQSLAPLRKGASKEWKRWIILLMGDWGSKFNIFQELTKWLMKQGVPAVLEWQPDTQGSNIGMASFPVQGQSQGAIDERAALRARVESGADKDGRPAVHVMRGSLFRGLEKPCVLVVHYDWRDDQPDEQTRENRDARLSKHCKELVRAVTCCQETLAVLFLSPSPAASKLH